MKSKLFSCVLLLILTLLAACDTTIPTPPPISIGITAVENSTALAQAVDEALAATNQANAHMTETVIANNGMTLTPSNTPTITATPSVTATRPVTATRTPTPTETFTPTYEPILTSTPAAAVNENFGWVRIMNSWAATNAQTASTPVDVFVNDDRIARAVEFGSQTNYYQVSPGAVRISLRTVDDGLNVTQGQTITPVTTTIVDVPPGGVISVVAMDTGRGLNLVPVREDSSPLAVGVTRLTIIQANPGLPAINIDATDKRLRLSTSMIVGDIIGPLDLPAGQYSLDLNDAKANNVTTVTTLPVNLTGQVSNILVLLPPATLGTGSVTSSLQRTGLTGRVENDIGIRFINALSSIGRIQLSVGQAVINNLGVSEVSPSLPVPALGAPFVVGAQGDSVTPLGNAGVIGPFNSETDNADKIVLLLPNTQANAQTPYVMASFSQNAPRSAINASIRLIHGLPGAVPLNLQIRPLRAAPSVEGQPAEAPAWATVGQAEYANASAYFSRNPEVYAVRVVQSGSQTVIAELPPQQFLAGGIYDFVVVPGSQTGSAELLMVEPNIQITELVQGSGNPTAVYEAVSGTLTALAPVQVEVTVTQTFTPTPTRTPIPTNTPRPTNTPEFRQPLLFVNPSPPDTAIDTINLVGENFQPKLQYVITLDSGNTAILTGQVNDDGTLLATITLPENLAIGIHNLRVCVDCRPRGLQQAAYAQFIKADPRITPTATAQP